MNAFDKIRALDALTFLTPDTLEERVSLAMRTADQRLYSHDLANAWLDWMGAHGHEIGRHDTELLARETLQLSPQHIRAGDLYTAIMRPREALPAEGRVVFMVTSCRKYFEQALRVQAALRARGAIACIIVGDPSQRVATWDGDLCTLPVADTYEALPLKVAAGVNALVQRFGAVSVVKIDDDTQLTPQFTVERFAQLALHHEYVGVPHMNPQHCRFWHFAKTQRAMGPYTRRFHGAWAGGPCYLMNPRAAALVAREYAFFPAEIGDEFYEDKAIGDFMRRQGVHLQPIRHMDWGITFDPAERFTAPPAKTPANAAPNAIDNAKTASAIVAPVPATISNPIPKLIHIVWIGDQSQRPDNLIATWIAHHPGWTIKVWGNDDLGAGPWHCTDQLLALGETSLQGLATLMQWEILYREGGVAVAADSLCIRGLDPALLAHERFGCRLSDSAEPGVLSASYFGCRPGDEFVARLLKAVSEDAEFGALGVSQAVGDGRLTSLWQACGDLSLVALPSHTFLPLHHAAAPHAGLDGVVACELWASTLGLTERLAGLSIESLRATLKLDDGVVSGAESARLEVAREFLSSGISSA